MRLNLKTKLILSFTIIIVLTGLITIIAGAYLIRKGVMNQVQDKVRIDLTSAREIWNNRINNIKDTIYYATIRNSIKNALIKKDRKLLRKYLLEMRMAGDIEMLAITDRKGRVVLRSHNPGIFGDSQANDKLVRKVLLHGNIASSAVIVKSDELKKDSMEFAGRAHIKFIHTPKAKERGMNEETSGMMLKVAAPILDKNANLIGVLYGGDLINRNYRLVDKIKNIVYHGEIYNGMDMGTATIFQRDLRISTNVMNNNKERAIGTRVSEEVYDRVLGEGKQWIDRAFVVNAWYITAYEPISDIDGDIIGILYVGMLEQKFVDMRRRTLLLFFAITIVGMILGLLVSNFFANKITKPINYLVKISKKISEGDFSIKVNVNTNDELGELEKAFNSMASDLLIREEELRNQTQMQLMRSEKLAALGRMAAGVAHEINNPLTGVLMYGHLLLRKLPEGSQNKRDAEIIVNETTRCRELIRDLLDFSRENVPHKKLARIDEVIDKAISIIENQVYFEKADLIREYSPDLPEIKIDINQIEQVLINLALNAIEAMPDGGKLIFRAKIDESKKNIIIDVSDTGCGITEENIEKIFDPFFTTKDVGQGTGLGLAVSYGIIKRHGGQFNVESIIDSGTTFTISIPIVTSDNC